MIKQNDLSPFEKAQKESWDVSEEGLKKENKKPNQIHILDKQPLLYWLESVGVSELEYNRFVIEMSKGLTTNAMFTVMGIILQHGYYLGLDQERPTND